MKIGCFSSVWNEGWYQSRGHLTIPRKRSYRWPSNLADRHTVSNGCWGTELHPTQVSWVSHLRGQTLNDRWFLRWAVLWTARGFPPSSLTTQERLLLPHRDASRHEYFESNPLRPSAMRPGTYSFSRDRRCQIGGFVSNGGT